MQVPVQYRACMCNALEKSFVFSILEASRGLPRVLYCTTSTIIVESLVPDRGELRHAGSWSGSAGVRFVVRGG
eukprot:COSAG02_NODE_3716_length_6329_cov_11.179133_1_plen_73_part_00